MKKTISILELYYSYQSYWISRKFVDIFGYNFLTNNLRIVNKTFKFPDLGDLKRICWTMAVPDHEVNMTDELSKKFLDILEASKERDMLTYHLNLVIKGLRQRAFHFKQCAKLLQQFNEYLGSSLQDNIYNLTPDYTPNFFEDKLIRDSEMRPVEFITFKEIVQADITDIDFTDLDVEYAFQETDCSI